jgi:acyl carrier protein
MTPTSHKELTEKVRLLIAENLGVDESEVTPSASFVDDLGADSLDQVELVMALEEMFSFQVSDEDTEAMLTVKDAMEYVEKHGKLKK